MSKNRPIRENSELEDVAIHIAYEIETMIFAADHLDGMHISPAVKPHGKEKDVFLEAFLLHYRNLRAFLCPSLQSGVTQDDVLASDFMKEPRPRDLADARVLGKGQTRINKLLAHISYERERHQKCWAVQEMRDKMVEAYVRFIGSLPQPLQGAFLDSERLRERLGEDVELARVRIAKAVHPERLG